MRYFTEIEDIDTGSFSRVCKIMSITTNKFYAAKIIDKKIIKELNLVERLKREIELLFYINHPGVIKLHYYFEEESNIILIMELIEDGSLFKLKNKVKCFNEKMTAKFVYQL